MAYSRRFAGEDAEARGHGDVREPHLAGRPGTVRFAVADAHHRRRFTRHTRSDDSRTSRRRAYRRHLPAARRTPHSPETAASTSIVVTRGAPRRAPISVTPTSRESHRCPHRGDGDAVCSPPRGPEPRRRCGRRCVAAAVPRRRGGRRRRRRRARGGRRPAGARRAGAGARARPRGGSQLAAAVRVGAAQHRRWMSGLPGMRIRARPAPGRRVVRLRRYLERYAERNDVTSALPSTSTGSTATATAIDSARRWAWCGRASWSWPRASTTRR